MNYITRINKARARKLYSAGETVYLAPCRANINSPWVHPYPVAASDDPTAAGTFDQRVNSFEYYMCCSELGRYAAYYIVDQED